MFLQRLRLLLALPCLALASCEHMPASFDASHFVLPHVLELFTQSEPENNAPHIHTNINEISTSGLNAWLVEDNSLPLVSVQIVFEGAGSSSDPSGKEGRAMFAAALLDEGAGDLSALAFQQALDDKAIQLSFTTSEDILVVQLRSLSEHLPDAFRLMALALTKPNFTPADITRKRAQALSTLARAKSQPGYTLAKRFNSLAYPNHAYGALPLGSQQSLRSITRTDLKNYLGQAITKERAVISATGDVSASALEALIATHLSALPDASMLPTPMQATLANQGTLHVAEFNAPQSQLLLATPAVDRRDPRFLAAYVLNHIVGGDTLTSVLGTAIREKKGLAYSAGSYLDPMSHSSNFKARLATKNEQVHEAYATLKAELARLGKDGVTQAQLDTAIQYLTGSFVLSLDNNTNYTRYLGTMQRFDLGKDYLAVRNDKIHAVTLEEVNALAAEMFDPKKWLVVVAGKPEKLTSGPIEK